MLCVPGLDRAHGGAVPHQHRVHPVAEQPLGQLGVLPGRADEIAERPEDAAVELLARGQQRRGCRRQPDPVPLQLLECLAASSHLRQRLLGPAALGPVERLVLASLGDQDAGALGVAGGALRFVAQEACPLHRVIAPALGTGQLLRKAGLVRGGLGGPLAQRAELALECRALALERAQRLGLLMQLLLPPADRDHAARRGGAARPPRPRRARPARL